MPKDKLIKIKYVSKQKRVYPALREFPSIVEENNIIEVTESVADQMLQLKFGKERAWEIVKPKRAEIQEETL